MSHEIDMSNGRANMAYTGETPWHELGEKLDENTPLDVWCEKAGLNWKVKSSHVRYATEELNTDLTANKVIDDQFVLYRSDTLAPLGVVGSRYVSMQPCEVLNFYKDLIEDFGYTIETAGSLFGGRKVWAMAKTPFAGEVVAGDVIKGYLLLTTGMDGETPTVGLETSVRVVCNNTLRLAVGGNGKRVSKRHTSLFDANAFKYQLGIYQENFNTFMDTARRLAAKSMSKDQQENVIHAVFGVKDVHKDESTRTKNIIQEIVAAVETGPGAQLPGVNGTAWGLVNGVTHYLDHLKSAKSDELRFYNNQFGQGHDIKERVVELALAA